MLVTYVAKNANTLQRDVEMFIMLSFRVCAQVANFASF